MVNLLENLRLLYVNIWHTQLVAFSWDTTVLIVAFATNTIVRVLVLTHFQEVINISLSITTIKY